MHGAEIIRLQIKLYQWMNLLGSGKENSSMRLAINLVSEAAVLM